MTNTTRTSSTPSRHFAIYVAAVLTLATSSAFAQTDAELDDQEQRFTEILRRVEPIQARFEPILFAHPGAVAVGIGLDAAFEPTLVVAVADRRLVDQLPTRFEGIPLDVHVTHLPRLEDGGPACNGGAGPPCHREQLPLPVQMGNSGAWVQATACTMGFKACDLDSGTSVLVTNAHCADLNTTCFMAPIGEDFQHTSPADEVIPGSGVVIGDIAGHAMPVCGAPDNRVDATKVTSAFFQSSKTIRDIGTPKDVTGKVHVPGWRIELSGRTTGFHSGRIRAVNATVNVPASAYCCGALTMRKRYMWQWDSYSSNFGYSGQAAVLRTQPGGARDMRLVGLHWGSDGTFGYLNHIQEVLAKRNLTLDFTKCGFPAD